MIGWVEGWFEKGKPKSWLTEYAPTLKELGEVQGPKVVGARWIHDGVAIYYSHPSIQVSYCLDIEGHGSTWINRRGDYKRGTSHTVRKAWENILNDAGIQYNFVPYNVVAVSGVPSAYKVLILPACYALSDIEAARITEFARNGGTVIADFACGIFDHHGKGRTSGALDSLFGVKHTGEIKKKDFFGGRLWTETNQDEPYNFKTFRHFLDASPCKLDSGFAVAERKLPVGIVAKAGNGRAVYLNLSPLRYLQYREEGTADDAKREPFIKHIVAGGVKPWVKITTAGKRPRNVEVTYWSKGGRTIVFVVQNVPLVGDDDGGGHGRGFVKEKMRIDIEFSGPVKGAIDERTGKELGDGQKFTVDYNSAEAALLSFCGAPPRL
jgi:PAS domain-containing protein